MFFRQGDEFSRPLRCDSMECVARLIQSDQEGQAFQVFDHQGGRWLAGEDVLWAVLKLTP